MGDHTWQYGAESPRFVWWLKTTGLRPEDGDLSLEFPTDHLWPWHTVGVGGPRVELPMHLATCRTVRCALAPEVDLAPKGPLPSGAPPTIQSSSRKHLGLEPGPGQSTNRPQASVSRTGELATVPGPPWTQYSRTARLAEQQKNIMLSDSGGGFPKLSYGPRHAGGFGEVQNQVTKVCLAQCPNLACGQGSLRGSSDLPVTGGACGTAQRKKHCVAERETESTVQISQQ